MARVLPSERKAFGALIGKRLRNLSTAFGLDYLRALVGTVVVKRDSATSSGNNAKLIRAVGAMEPLAREVPFQDWCAKRIRTRA